MPYSCQLQLGTSGIITTPVGAGRTWRAIARAMSHTSRFPMVQMAPRAPPGSFSAGRSTIAENSWRWRGSSGMGDGGDDVVGLHDEAECGADAHQGGIVQRR